MHNGGIEMAEYKLAEHIIDRHDISKLIKWLENNPQLTKGALTPQFEEQWATWVGTRYAVFCNSGSSANLLMAYAVLVSGRLRNNKVIVPSVGWATTIAPFIQFGFKPIMCGADKDTYALDANHLERLLQRHDAASVILVQVLGVPAEMEPILELRRAYDVVLLEDACAALGASYGGKKVGSFGKMSSFSFYYGHQLSTIEGGMVNTDDEDLYNVLVMLRSHGWGKDLDLETRSRLMKKYRIEEFHEPFTFFVPGFNLRSTDANAFLGLLQMEKADKVAAIRKRNHLMYAEILIGVDFQKWSEKADPCSISFGALAQNEQHRKRIVTALAEHAIETRLFSAGNLGRHPFWFERYGMFRDSVADRVHDCGFFLPNNESLTEDGVTFICEVVNNVKP